MYPSTALISISAASLLLACEQRAAPPGADSHPSPPRAEARTQPDDPRVVCPPESRQRRTEDRWTVSVGCLDAQGLLHGPGRRWTKAGQLIWDETAVHGKREGIRRIWNEAGQLTDEDRYHDGKLEGTGRSWYAAQSGSPRLAVEYAYHEGKVNGVARAWHPNGRLRAEATFKDNELVGAVRAWDDRGRRISVKDPEQFFPTPFQLRWKEQER